LDEVYAHIALVFDVSAQFQEPLDHSWLVAVCRRMQRSKPLR
jgi:hypothetical protein